MNEKKSLSKKARKLRPGLATGLTLLFVSAAGVSIASGQETKTRVGVIGLVHGHAWGNLREMTRLADVEFVGIAEPMEVLHRYTEEYAPGVRLFADVDAFLRETRPQIVWAFVENNRHLEIVERCAPLGIHVIFEKPLASKLADARAIRRLANQHQIHVLTNYQMAWWPTSYAAFEAARSGKIGEVWRVRGIIGHGGPGGGRSMKIDPAQDRRGAFYDWLNDAERNGGGSLIDFGCYGALWANWYLGKPESVWAMANHRRPEVYDVEDNAVILCRYDRGVAILEGSWSLPRSFQDVEVFGTEGSVSATRYEALLIQGRQRQVEPIRLEAPPLPPSRASAVAYLIHCLKTNQKPEGMVALDINVDVVEILEAARQSIESGRSVKLPLP